MAFTVPNFAASLKASDKLKEGPPVGYAIAATIGSLIPNLAADFLKNKQEKQFILAMADSIEETNPAMASAYRAMAGSIPMFTPGAIGGGGGGSGGGSGGGGGGGGQSKVMSSMLDMLQMQQRANAEIMVDNSKTQNDLGLAKVRHRLEMAQMATSFKGQAGLISARASAEKDVADLKARYEQETDARTRANLEKEWKIKEAQIGVMNRQAANGEQELKQRAEGTYQEARTGASTYSAANIRARLAMNPDYVSASTTVAAGVTRNSTAQDLKNLQLAKERKKLLELMAQGTPLDSPLPATTVSGFLE